MMRQIGPMLVVVAIGAGQVARGADDVKDEVKKLQGEWPIIAQEQAGGNVLDRAGDPKVVFDGDKLTFKIKGGGASYTVKLDPSASPKAADCTALEGPLKGQVNPAIYMLDGNELWICFGGVNHPRPDAFGTRDNLFRTLIKCKRPKAPDEATTKELKKLNGTWAIVSMESHGRVLPERNVAGMKYIISEGKIVIPPSGPPSTSARPLRDTICRCELNVSAKPKTIDIVDWTDDKPGATFLGIYLLDGDELTICQNSSGEKERPTAFETTRKSKISLLKLKREKR